MKCYHPINLEVLKELDLTSGDGPYVEDAIELFKWLRQDVPGGTWSHLKKLIQAMDVSPFKSNARAALLTMIRDPEDIEDVLNAARDYLELERSAP
jgi:hypothetical protein